VSAAAAGGSQGGCTVYLASCRGCQCSWCTAHAHSNMESTSHTSRPAATQQSTCWSQQQALAQLAVCHMIPTAKHGTPWAKPAPAPVPPAPPHLLLHVPRYVRRPEQPQAVCLVAELIGHTG
jgi:hypothetical protein